MPQVVQAILIVGVEDGCSNVEFGGGWWLVVCGR